MTISKFDVSILISMTLAVVLISFTFPALGFTADTVVESDMPSFNASADTFEVFVDRPEQPNYPSRGVLNRSSDQFDNFEGFHQQSFGPGTSGETVIVTVFDFNGEVRLLNDSAMIVDNHTFTSAGEEHELSGDGFIILVHANDISLGTYEYVVEQRPQDSAWYEGIPLIGGLFSTADQTAATLAWVGSWVAYALAGFSVGSLNIAFLILDIVIFGFSFAFFVISTYATIIANAPTAWVSVFVGIPGALLSFVFAKIGIAAIKLVPGI